MSMRAIISVHDKTGLVDFGGKLAALGWDLVASGGTAQALRVGGLSVVEVTEITGAPEMLSGRVKTLHPAVHGGILARDSASDRTELARYGITPLDMVVCNLYPFASTVSRPGVALDEAIEQIDIGGVTLLRAGAKNYERVYVVCDPADYEVVISELTSDREGKALRQELAVKAFAHTRDYDAAIAAYLSRATQFSDDSDDLPKHVSLSLSRVQSLRYGENPHQAAALYGLGDWDRPLGGELLQGKELSYNNLLDLDAAWRTAEAFDSSAVVIVKHLSPCGIATAETISRAFAPALASDPLSAFGGVIAANRHVDDAFVEALAAADLFVEAVIAPSFSPGAADWFSTKKRNCRLVALGDSATEDVSPVEWRTIRGGYVAQFRDTGDPATAEWRVVSARQPTPAEAEALHFCWVAVQHAKSNAIVFAKGTATVGIGAGLPSRVDAVKLAVAKAGLQADGAVMASDAFFPFPDGIEAAAQAGITAVVQPGGSVRDDEVIAAVDRLGLAMVFTGARHFRH